MLQNKPIRIRKYLLPISWLYGFIIFLRNKFFDWGIYKEEQYDIPIICVGNITVGGTGKTPHTELLVKLLHEEYRVGVLSRGYKRKTKGFILSDENSTSRDIGDEPYQIKHKYPDVILAVDGDRRRGIKKLLALDNPPQVIILDDGFQHRYVKPSFVILLSNYNRPIYEDKMLPAGLLRDNARRMDKANMVIITKCPGDMQPIDYRIITHDIDLLAYQDLFFTSFKYSKLYPVFDNFASEEEMNFLCDKKVLLVTGIASPKVITKHIEAYTDKLDVLSYGDHHSFSKKDIKHINKRFDDMDSTGKLIVVTEKDAARLILASNLSDDVKSTMYYLPIEVEFERDKNEINNFKQKIIDHVKDHTRNS